MCRRQPGLKDSFILSGKTDGISCGCSAAKTESPRGSSATHDAGGAPAHRDERRLTLLIFQEPGVPGSGHAVRCIRQVSSMSPSRMRDTTRESTRCMQEAVNWLRFGPRDSNSLQTLVGAERFELPTPCSQNRCATRLRYAPTRSSPYSKEIPLGKFLVHEIADFLACKDPQVLRKPWNRKLRM